MEKQLTDLWPLYGVENDCLLSRSGDVTLGYELALPELFTLSDQDYQALHQVLVKAFRVLPKGTIIHKQDWFTGTAYRADFEKENNSFLSRASERFFNERPYLDHTSYLLITKKPEGRKLATSLLSGLTHPSPVPREVVQPGLLESFFDACTQVERILTDSGFFGLRRLREQELCGSGNEAGLTERYLTLQPPGGPLLLRDLSFSPGIRIGDTPCELYTLCDAADLPSCCGPRINYDRYGTDRSRFSVGFAAPVGHLLPCNHIYNQYIFLEDAQKTIQRLEARRLRLQSLAAYSRENALARDAVNDFLNEALAEGRLPVKAHFNILAWSGEKHQEKELRGAVSSALTQMDAVPRLEVDGAPQIFWAGLPGGEADFPMNDTFDCFLEQACCLLNLETAYRSSLSPTGMRLGERLSGRPLHVDLSDEPIKRGICTNRNKFILGPSGSGKSFFTNHMVRSYYEQGTHIVLIDVGHSYRGLCELVGGYYFTYEERNPIRFNPFYTGEESTPDTEKKESIKTLLLALWKKDHEPYSRSEYVALSTALTTYYHHLEKNPGLFPCFDTFYEFLQTGYAEVLRRDSVKEKDFDLSSFLYVLRPYYRGGEFDYLLNATENLDLLHERFIVFELDNIKDHPILFPVVTIIIMEVFISKMRKLGGVRKMILIEEAWKAIAREGMAEYIRYLFKTVRKFFGEAVVVTQEVEDIISSPVVRQAIVGNSDCKILLDQTRYLNRFDEIQQLLGLTEKEKAQVLSLNRANEPGRKYKEVFISLGGTLSKVYRVEVSPEEYLAYTTEQTEKVALLARARQLGGDLEKAITLMARESRATSPPL